jgi:hypothetical protein
VGRTISISNTTNIDGGYGEVVAGIRGGSQSVEEGGLLYATLSQSSLHIFQLVGWVRKKADTNAGE